MPRQNINLHGVHMKIYCDVAAFPNNALHNDTKTKRELAAIEELLVGYAAGKVSLMGSLVCLRELLNTTNDEKRIKLRKDFDTLECASNDEKVFVFHTQYDQLSGFSANPLVSDVQDGNLRNKLMKRGLDQKDAEHLTQTICNGCDVFLTRDENTIITLHRTWIEVEFSPIKVRLPTELVFELRKTL